MLCALILTYPIAIYIRNKIGCLLKIFSRPTTYIVVYESVQVDSLGLQPLNSLIHSALIATLQLVKKLTQSLTRLVKGSLVVVWDWSQLSQQPIGLSLKGFLHSGCGPWLADSFWSLSMVVYDFLWCRTETVHFFELGLKFVLNLYLEISKKMSVNLTLKGKV